MFYCSYNLPLFLGNLTECRLTIVQIIFRVNSGKGSLFHIRTGQIPIPEAGIAMSGESVIHCSSTFLIGFLFLSVFLLPQSVEGMIN